MTNPKFVSNDEGAPPITCSLGADDAADRVDQWRQALKSAVTGEERVSQQRLSLRVREQPEAVASLVLLARLEKACCPFFNFTFHVDVDAVVLDVEVPAGAEAILDEFAGFAHA